ncbi:hypothetical protein HanIR_Chr07g0322031 [Helianthus annuus]|nr:hypothetical protein HanIR_Chr07g0322031 [Helianthus annuus]
MREITHTHFIFFLLLINIIEKQRSVSGFQNVACNPHRNFHRHPSEPLCVFDMAALFKHHRFYSFTLFTSVTSTGPTPPGYGTSGRAAGHRPNNRSDAETV